MHSLTPCPASKTGRYLSMSLAPVTVHRLASVLKFVSLSLVVFHQLTSLFKPLGLRPQFIQLPSTYLCAFTQTSTTPFSETVHLLPSLGIYGPHCLTFNPAGSQGAQFSPAPSSHVCWQLEIARSQSSLALLGSLLATLVMAAETGHGP